MYWPIEETNADHLLPVFLSLYQTLVIPKGKKVWLICCGYRDGWRSEAEMLTCHEALDVWESKPDTNVSFFFLIQLNLIFGPMLNFRAIAFFMKGSSRGKSQKWLILTVHLALRKILLNLFLKYLPLKLSCNVIFFTDSKFIKNVPFGGTWVVQSVKHLISAQVMNMFPGFKTRIRLPAQ